MTMMFPGLVAMLVAAGAVRSESVSVVYPKTVHGASALMAVERMAARYEQASGATESSIDVLDSFPSDADLVARCSGTGASQVLYLNPATLTVLSTPARLQLFVEARLVRCADKSIARSQRNADIAGNLLENPSVKAGYKSLEASVISDLLAH